MASLIPVPSGREVARVFEKFGWIQVRQKASHIIMTEPGEVATLSSPDHKEVARGTLRSLIPAANLSVQQFVNAAG